MLKKKIHHIATDERKIPLGIRKLELMDKLYRFLSRPYMVVVVMAIAPILALADRNYGYFFGLFIAIFLFWKSGWNWSKFGFGQKVTIKTIIRGLLLAIGIYVLVDVCIQPFLEIHFGQIDYSSIDDIQGDFAGYFVLMLVMWVFAAFGEEFLFSGYYMKGLAELIGDTDRAWYLAAIILSVYFGVSHNYQGTAGMIAVGLASLIYFFVFAKNRTNLALLVFTHGFYDSIGITMIYLNQDKIFYDWVLENLV